MSKGDHLGELELLVLLAVMRIGENAYGVTIHEEIKTVAGRNLTRQTLYEVLRRLEDKGLLESKFGDPTPERGGRAKKFLKLSGNAVAVVSESLRRLDRMRQTVPALEAAR